MDVRMSRGHSIALSIAQALVYLHSCKQCHMKVKVSLGFGARPRTLYVCAVLVCVAEVHVRRPVAAIVLCLTDVPGVLHGWSVDLTDI